MHSTKKIPKYFRLIVAAVTITGSFAILEPVRNFNYVLYTQVLILAETIRIFVTVLRAEKRNAWILTSGFMLLFLFSMYDFLTDLGFIESIANINNGYPSGFLCLIIAASIYLARDFAKANMTILQKEHEAKEMEIEQKLLEAEDKRKAKELNDTRELQLSLLP